jgi:uncharacterized membrane protein
MGLMVVRHRCAGKACSPSADNLLRMRKLAVRRYLIAGMLILLPLWLTLLAVRWAFDTLSAVTRPVVEPALDQIGDATGANLTWLLVVVSALLTLTAVYLAGVLGTRVLGARVHHGIDFVVGRVPLVNTIYASAKKLMAVVESAPDKAQRVVLIESGRSGSTSVGFVTRVLTDASSGKEYAAVFVPTTPNPTSGALQLVPIEDLRPSDISVDEAMSFVLSGGAVAPARFDAQPED